jgi:hypothetical protein
MWSDSATQYKQLKYSKPLRNLNTIFTTPLCFKRHPNQDFNDWDDKNKKSIEKII